MKYFSNLKNGWANLTIGDFNCPCSYIQNVPLTILSAYKEFQQNKYCIITIDSEGYEHEIIITSNAVHIFTYKDRVSYFNLSDIYNTSLKKIELLKDLCKDIVDNATEWAEWMCLTDPKNDCYDNIIEAYKKEILDCAKGLNL